MEGSVKKSKRAINWKAIANYEITSSWTRKKQADVLLYIAQMSSEGFQLIEIFQFLGQIYPEKKEDFQAMESQLIRGNYFYQTLSILHFPQSVIFQVKVSEEWGDFAKDLLVISDYLKTRDQQRQEIRKTLRYPAFLVGMIAILLGGLRLFLLPQLKAMGISQAGGLAAILLGALENMPLLLAGFLGLSILFLIGGRIWYKKHSPLYRAQRYVKLPLIGRVYRLYYTYFFAYEFSQLFAVGYSIKQIIETFSSQEEVPFLKDFGQFLQASYQGGQPVSKALKESGVFEQEFPSIVQQGELLNQLAIKMRLFSQRCLESFHERIHGLIIVAQNVMFIFVATLVVMVYLLLMLPMFNMLGAIQ
ncbi:competence type IV pilus assembly protein ComGB [Aerococcus christensenii]|uniref:Bacterial type II secretion system protein F domain protein n=2 Tax=Aerococcus christensenii TaxID=87541 RepID=A0A133XYN5_9LACT|nr:competence type IV pilus assembly protein ComGB [Aerococcus christensenii]KXB36040.1 bacterial type II secretion system protein F domain protein [Aerococcus christensenii]MDK8234411.1 competence type IV pilus assembly protein ComGB [Aerococcus christensenii]